MLSRERPIDKYCFQLSGNLSSSNWSSKIGVGEHKGMSRYGLMDYCNHYLETVFTAVGPVHKKRRKQWNMDNGQ